MSPVTKIVLLALSSAIIACGGAGGAGLPSIDAAGNPGSPDAAGLGDGGGLAADARPAGGLGHPFGMHGGYFPTGVIFPGHPQAELDSATATFYDQWKGKYLVAGCAAGQFRVKTNPATDPYTVSEGHGYGMLIAVIMAGHDPDAQKIFDGLYGYYDTHRSANNPDLMAWAQDQACADVMGPDSATDGDLDVAYALLLADKQWGSGGTIDYATAGKKVVAAILASDVHPANSILVGDWAGAGDSHYTGTRPSDFMPSHFKAFGAASGVARWSEVEGKTYAVIDYLQVHAAAASGLLPDFAVAADGATPTPAPASWLEGADDGRYSYNACRTPWRIATDYLMSGEPRAQGAVRRMNTFIRGKTGDDPTKIRDGYDLSGTVTGSSAELSFVAPFAVGAMVEPATGTNQAWLTALWDDVAARGLGEYYGDSIKMLTMIVMSGNWWTP